MANVAAIVEQPSEGRREALGCVVVLHDVSRLKELERAKEQFIRMVAHELRAPMAVIVQSLDAVLGGAVSGDSARQQRILSRCKDRALGLISLVEDLLRVSAIEAGRIARKVEPVDVGEAVRETVAFFRPQAEARGIELRTVVEECVPPVSVDRSDLGLVLTNLLSNAIKYNRDGGWVEMSARASGKGVSIEVADGGVGIPDEHQAGVFKEFYRVKTPETVRIAGTGLGLPIVKRLVEAHHGRVWLRSKYGEGSTFGVWLPGPAEG
jgi:signal transduction histidine kinase